MTVLPPDNLYHSPFLYNTTMFAIAGAGLHLLVKPIDEKEKLFEKINLYNGS
jgi:hypothetical protein